MIVIDASAMVEALVGRAVVDELFDALSGSGYAPHLLDVEVMSVLRGLTLARKLPPAVADRAIADYDALTIARYEFSGLSERVWRLRNSFTTYDACYLALAEAVDAPLYTCDRKLAASGHAATVRVLPRSG